MGEAKGSLVDPEKLRFDFSHGKALSEEEVGRVEELVSQNIERQLVYPDVIGIVLNPGMNRLHDFARGQLASGVAPQQGGNVAQDSCCPYWQGIVRRRIHHSP